MSEHEAGFVWVSQAFGREQTATGLYPFGVEEGGQGAERDIDVFTRIEKAEKVSQNELPEELYASKEWNDHLIARRHLMSCGFYLISDPVRQVLEQFDLGEGAVHLAKIYNPDKKTAWDEVYWHLNVVGTKNALLPEVSKLKKIYSKTRDIWRPGVSLKSDEISFNKNALGGADIWMDERLLSCFLLSDRLVSALKAAKLDKPWQLTRCKVF